MKKKKINRLSLNKKAISNLGEDVKGGIQDHGPIPTHLVSKTPTYCATKNNQCPSSVYIWCNVSCYIC